MLSRPDENTYSDVLLSGSGGGEATGTLTPTHNRVLFRRPGQTGGVLELNDLDLKVVQGLLQEILFRPETPELLLDLTDVFSESISCSRGLVQEHRHLLVELAEHLDDSVAGDEVCAGHVRHDFHRTERLLAPQNQRLDVFGRVLTDAKAETENLVFGAHRIIISGTLPMRC